MNIVCLYLHLWNSNPSKTSMLLYPRNVNHICKKNRSHRRDNIELPSNRELQRPPQMAIVFFGLKSEAPLWGLSTPQPSGTPRRVIVISSSISVLSLQQCMICLGNQALDLGSKKHPFPQGSLIGFDLLFVPCSPPLLDEPPGGFDGIFGSSSKLRGGMPAALSRSAYGTNHWSCWVAGVSAMGT